MKLSSKKSYVQVALNSTIEESLKVVAMLPADERIIYEIGTPMIKEFGMSAVRQVRAALSQKAIGAAMTGVKIQPSKGLKGIFEQMSSGVSENTPYIVADMKTIDRAEREIAIAKSAGADGVVMMGNAPIETLRKGLEVGKELSIDIFIDMMNVDFPLSILRELGETPKGVYLHRGVDETEATKKQLPMYEIRRILGEKDVMIGVAGGDTSREIQSAIFNDADIVVIWKAVYQADKGAKELVEEVLQNLN
jgi:bifunctional enzyme Fae/Hps